METDHTNTLLKRCMDCGMWTQFEPDKESTSVISAPPGVKAMKCFNCGGITFDHHSTISHRTFDFTHKDGRGKKVIVYEQAKKLTEEGTDGPRQDTATRTVRTTRSVQPRDGRKPVDRNKRRPKVQEGQGGLFAE